MAEFDLAAAVAVCIVPGVPGPHRFPKGFGCHSHDPGGPQGGIPAVLPSPGHSSP